MGSFDDQVKEKLGALRVQYFAELPRKVADVVACFDRWHDAPDPQQLHECYRMAHSLAGSGALYGAPELSGKAKEFELLLKEPAVNKTGLDADRISQGRVLLTELSSLATALHAQPPT